LILIEPSPSQPNFRKAEGDQTQQGEDPMNFYNTYHAHYCGIDLHARSLYVCILDQAGDVLLHNECSANPEQLLSLITPYLDDW